MSTINTALIEKIQKLLSLANSSNEHEAKLAASRASELLLKYNLSIQEVEKHDGSYTDQVIAEGKSRLSYHQNLILDIVNAYFFTRSIIRSRRTLSGMNKIVILIGLPENCKIAAYIYDYLMQIYPKLWKEYKRSLNPNYRDSRARRSYYLGLTTGIGRVLEESRFRVQEQTGLVLVKDSKLDEVTTARCNGTYKAPENKQIDTSIYRDGIEDGKNVKLRKPIETDRQDSGRLLAHEETVA